MYEAKPSHVGSNPIIQSVIHQTFSHAIRDVGFPEFTESEFVQAIQPHLNKTDSLIPNSESSRAKLWRAVMRGEVVAAEVWDGDDLVFYVRGAVSGTFVDLRLVFDHTSWKIFSVTMYVRPLRRTTWFIRTASAVALVVAGVIGYAIPHTHAASQPVSSQTVVTASTPATTAPTAGQSANAQTEHTTTTPTSASKAPQPETPKSIPFTLKQGMSLDQISQFLKKQHLVKSAIAFDMVMKRAGVDKHLRPGTFTFQSDMTVNQLIQVLQNGPSKS